ncbi:hypothetical protein [Allosphingosinicella sp.]|jgi:hypothetical protein|uniref:hypothetical protein n=1 Tax=Allosphingosinicella sp. TaxID=2823234 RepID=UPI002EFD65BE
MTFVGLFGILAGLLAWPFAFADRANRRPIVFVAAYLVHVASAVVYFYYIQSASSDAYLYYYDEYGFYAHPVRFGTGFVIHLTQFLKANFGGSFLDYFLVFQAMGFWGIVFLMRTFEEIYGELGARAPMLVYLMLFLPGIHFWTSAIGKDAPLFLATSLSVWSMMHLRRRALVFAAAIFIMVLIRPHIALLAMLSLALAAFMDPKARGYVKVTLLAVALAGAAVVAGTVQSAFDLDVTSAESVGEFLTRQSEVTGSMGGGTAVIGASFPVRVVSLLFRPFFIDAEGAFGLIASVENVFIMFVIGTILFRMRGTLRLARNVFFLRYALFFSMALIILLSLIYYNVGLGLRQKMMIMPGLLAFFAALHAVRMARRSRPTVSSA